jgi:broad specificity phosphatase PhoE
MAYLILIRHSISRQVPDLSAHKWSLSEEGIRLCETLATQIQPYDVKFVCSSYEPKAVQTAQEIAKVLHRFDSQIIEGLEETHRETAPYYKNVGDFQAAVISAMHRPDEVVFGEEAFEAARLRFDQALHDLMEKHADETVAAVSHGTVMSLWLGPLLKRPVQEVWQAMGMPAYVVIEWPEKRIIHFQETLA